MKEKQQLLLFFTQIEQDIMESEFDSEKPFWLLSLRKGLKVAKAEIEWAEECIAELES
ncbi:hypothetical protein D3C80_2130230 [compost metagenome]